VPFGAVLCGIDTSPQSLAAAGQALALAADDANVWGVSVWDPGVAMLGGIHASEVALDLRRDAIGALQEARRAFPRLDPILMKGPDAAGLLAATVNLEPDLVSVGSHGSSRPAGVLFGSVATAIAHHATCSVLISRAAETFPGVILHASDGSLEGLAAARVAGEIAAVHDSTVVTLHVTDGDLERGRGIAEAGVALIEAAGREPVVQVLDGSPHRRIPEVADEIGASLIVIGSRGRTGLAALGSVSERIAHHAPCSVLIVRLTSHPSRDREMIEAD
jgi:nucleotide-binding universal stress UspA family protein